ELEGDLDHRPDAGLRVEQPVSTRMRIVIAMSALALGACASSPKHDTYALPPEAVATPVPVANGSIYASTQNIALFEDRKARQVGDVLTVLLVEKTDARKSAATNTSKDSSFSMP